MEFANTYFVMSPSSVLVALVTAVFLMHRAWHLFSKSKSADHHTDINITPTSVPDLIVSKEPEIPDGWWTGRDVFELERRALFSQKWTYLAHIAQFSKPGAYQSFDLAGFPLFLIRGKDDKIRAFHNVCRHRAYTITRKETGASTVLGCRYHGWSYDTTGRLVKAPQFDDVPGFDKTQNSLFEVHTHTTDSGLVFVNLDAGQPSEFESDDALASKDFGAILGTNGPSKWIAGQTKSGNFNWKMTLDTSRFGSFAGQLEKEVSAISGSFAITKAVRYVMQMKTHKETHLFPTTFLCSLTDTKLWFTLSFFPSSEKKTQIRYDLFSPSPVKLGAANSQSMAEAFEKAIGRLSQDIENDYDIASKQQGLQAEFNVQATHEVVNRIQEHMRLERKQGGQILPAMHKPKGSNLFQQAEKLCKELDCVSGESRDSASSNALDW